MASTQFQLESDRTFLPADISNGVMYTSPEQVNGVGSDLSTGLRVVFDYHDLQSSPTGAALQGVIEGKAQGGQFYNLAYQFCEFRAVGFQQKRQLVVSPDLVVLDPGIDNIIFVGGLTIEQISNQQGILPATWRIRVIISNPSGFFQSVRMSIYGERFNQFADVGTILTDVSGEHIADGGSAVIV